MREVLSISDRGGVDSNNNNNNNSDNNNNNSDNNSDKRPDIRMSAQPGYLELSQEGMDRLVCHDPIDEQYEVEDQPFARGKYAAVRRCRDRHSGQQFAAKVLKKHRRSADLRPEILHEVAILDACAASSRIVRLERVFESQHEMVLVLELAPGGELQTLLDNDEIPDETQVKRLMTQILDGLIFLHSINVAHLDLKPQNLVLTGQFPHCDVKLCDLGIARYISQGADIRDILGTPDYVAPEVLNYESISLATDMWSVGVLLYVLLTGCSPFGGDTKQETFCNISQCNLDFPQDLFEDISEDAIDLMRRLMVKDPSQRLSATQCLDHRWFTAAPPLPASPCPTRCRTQEAGPQSPAPIRKQPLDIASQSPNTVAKSAKHKAPVETTITDKPSDFQPPEILVTKPEPVLSPAVPDNVAPSPGMKSFRRDNLKRNLSELAERLSKTTDSDSSVDGTTLFVKPPVYSPVSTAKDNSCYDFGTIRKSKSMHMLSILNDTYDSQNVVQHNVNYSPVRRRNNKECLYSFRKCVVIEDDDVSPPMSIAGSVTSSLASDNSICDSSSEVSELSIDSSSDRSSIISLDDSVEYNTRTGRYTNVWNKRMSLGTNETFASAFRRFSTVENAEKPVSATSALRRPARGAHTVALNRALAPSAVSTMCKLEFRKERFGNVVVIREVKAGRFLQVNEVKCESVQERIRRLQVQGIEKT